MFDILLRHIPSTPSQDVRKDHGESFEGKFSSFREKLISCNLQLRFFIWIKFGNQWTQMGKHCTFIFSNWNLAFYFHYECRQQTLVLLAVSVVLLPIEVHIFLYYIFYCSYLEILFTFIKYTEAIVHLNLSLYLVHDLLKMHINCYSTNLFLKISS